MIRKFLDGTALTNAVQSGQSTAREAVQPYLNRITERDAEVASWAYHDADYVLQQAAALDNLPPSKRGPLHGMPIGVKDVLLTQDMPTQYGCDFYTDFAPAIDASIIAVLRQAGAIMMGKTTTVELASIGKPAATANPHNLDHTPGGSSSGSAAAVADGQVPIALGTQTGGSIIRPASFCGTWALKPTWGIIPADGAKNFAPSLDTVGWFGSSARDLKTLLNLLAPQIQQPTALPSKLRIAVWHTAGWPRAEAATRQAMDQAITMLHNSGAIVEVLDLPAPFTQLADAHHTIMMTEGGRSFLPEYRIAPDKIHPRIVQMVTDSQNPSASSQDKLRSAYDLAAEARAKFDAIAQNYDAILTPSTLGSAPYGLNATGDLLFNGLLTLLHVPCINMPLWNAENGMPVGLTLTGARFDDHRLIDIAKQIDEMVPDQHSSHQ